jgi:HPt (histidine-containing phosphotransfer) domain-containing protein
MPKTFDIDALKNELELDQEDVVELFDDFKSFIEETMPKLKAVVETNDMAQSRALSHSIKGSAGNLRIQEVYALSKQMQANSEASDGENLKVNFGKLETAVSEFLQELTTL